MFQGPSPSTGPAESAATGACVRPDGASQTGANQTGAGPADIHSPTHSATLEQSLPIGANSPGAAAALAPLQAPSVAPLASREPTSILREVIADLRTAGVTNTLLLCQLGRGVGSEVARWGATMCLFAYGLQAAADGSSLALAFVAAWVVASQLATWLDYGWRTRMDELDRAYGRVLTSRLVRTQGNSTLKDLDDELRQGEIELQHSRISTISNLVESTVAVPSHLARLALSSGALLVADWRVALAITLAVVPGFIVKQRQVKEDLRLEKLQAPREKIIDTVSDEVYLPHGSIRMVLGRFTERIARSLARANKAIDEERNIHERRQARHLFLADSLYYAVLGGSMALLFNQYQNDALSLGLLTFLWLQLIDLGDELDSQGDAVQTYIDLGEKTAGFYRSTVERPQVAALPFPEVPVLTLRQATFLRGSPPHTFSVTTPDVTVRPGSLLLIRGASGAGKSTLHRALAFGERPEIGDYLIGGIPAQNVSRAEWHSHIAYCGPTAALMRGLTIDELLSLDPDGPKHLQERIKHPLIVELMQKLESIRGTNTRIGAGLPDGIELSSGELQRIMLITALVPRRELLFLDEVTSNQSEDFLRIFEDELQKQRELGTTVVMVTHSKRFDHVATKILRVSKGEAELDEPGAR